MDFYTTGMPKVSRVRDFPSLSDPTVTIMTISEHGYVSQYTGNGERKRGLISSHTLRPGDLVLAILPTIPATVAVVDDRKAFCEEFGAKATEVTTLDVEAALARAWRACAETGCPQCGVEAWQYCRNEIKGAMYAFRFHRGRQDAAGVRAILKPVGLPDKHWQNGVGRWEWDERLLRQS
ncbi:hypothetical protein ACFVHI_02495 [Kitasatospora sp. NPDC127121]|uniref:hypothetical protein n=1 Tax=unclassified Kitasatospora TaxID=2633591 RepID=UPI00362F1CF6